MCLNGRKWHERYDDTPTSASPPEIPESQRPVVQDIPEGRHNNMVELPLEQQTSITEGLPRYEEAVNLPRSVRVTDDVGGPNPREGTGKVNFGEESPPDYDVAKDKENP